MNAWQIPSQQRIYTASSLCIVEAQCWLSSVRKFTAAWKDFAGRGTLTQKVSQIKKRLRKVPATKISLYFYCRGADISSWVAFYWSFESPHKSSWLKLDERSRGASHQNPVKHPVGGIKIDLPVTLGLTLWPWPSVDQWFKCGKVQIIACAMQRRTLVWGCAVIAWNGSVLLTPNLLLGIDQAGFRRYRWWISWPMTNTPHLMSTVGRSDMCEHGMKLTFVMPANGKWIKNIYHAELFLTSYET